MFADKFNANNRTYPSRERCPRRSVGFDAFHGQQQGSSVRIVFQIAVDDAHIVHSQCEKIFALGELVRRDAESYGLSLFCAFSGGRP